MNQLLLNKFQDFVVTHYSDYELSTKSICSDIHCSKSSLQRTLSSHYGYSTMKYVEYFRILKSIELTYYKGQKKVCYKIGYKYPSNFCRAFFKVTKLHVSDFFSSRFKENKKVTREVSKIAKENPGKAIDLILNDISKRSKFSKGKMTRKK